MDTRSYGVWVGMVAVLGYATVLGMLLAMR
jgi:hypothetical protein